MCCADVCCEVDSQIIEVISKRLRGHDVTLYFNFYFLFPFYFYHKETALNQSTTTTSTTSSTRKLTLQHIYSTTKKCMSSFFESLMRELLI